MIKPEEWHFEEQALTLTQTSTASYPVICPSKGRLVSVTASIANCGLKLPYATTLMRGGIQFIIRAHTGGQQFEVCNWNGTHLFYLNSSPNQEHADVYLLANAAGAGTWRHCTRYQ